MLSKVVEQVHCKTCGESMGEFDEDELICLMLEGVDTVLCFNCDPESASTTPSLFWQWQAGELFTFGDSVFCVAANQKEIVEVGFARTHERTRAPGLSSYTYLNRNNKEWAVLGKLIEFEICPECFGKSFFAEINGGEVCGGCADFGSLPVLPKWIRFLVSGEVRNA